MLLNVESIQKKMHPRNKYAKPKIYQKYNNDVTLMCLWLILAMLGTFTPKIRVRKFYRVRKVLNAVLLNPS